MLSSFVIVLREGIEAALIVGLVLAAIRRSGALHLARSVWFGVGLALGVSLVVGLGFALTVGNLPDEVAQTVEGIASLTAVLVLTYMVFWMRRQSRTLSRQIDDKVGAAASVGSGWAVGVLAFSAVLREGLETALFLYATLTASSALAGAVGALLGLAVAIGLGYALYTGSLRLDLRSFFTVTGVVIIVLAAGLLAYGIHELQEVGALPVVVEHLWDTNHLLDETAGVGAMLKGLVGYNGNPSLLEVVAYWSYLLVVGTLFLRSNRKGAVSGGRPTTTPASTGGASAV